MLYPLKNLALLALSLATLAPWMMPIATGAQTPSPLARPLVREGSEGEIIRELQSVLQLLGYFSGEVNGTFDDATKKAVIRFQTAATLEADGIVGPQTWRSLLPSPAQLAPKKETNVMFDPTVTVTPDGDPILWRGMAGDAVRDVQNRLKNLGFYGGAIDGIFGEATLEAVIRAQEKFRLTPDGVVGTQTWRSLRAN